MTVQKRWLAIGGMIISLMSTLFSQYMDHTGIFTPAVITAPADTR